MKKILLVEGDARSFSIGALLRKIRAMFVMLEHRGLARDFYDDGRLSVDFSEQSASLNGKPLTLSPMEYKMLYLFCKNPKQILTRQRLLERLWTALPHTAPHPWKSLRSWRMNLLTFLG